MSFTRMKTASQYPWKANSGSSDGLFLDAGTWKCWF